MTATASDTVLTFKMVGIMELNNLVASGEWKYKEYLGKDPDGHTFLIERTNKVAADSFPHQHAITEPAPKPQPFRGPPGSKAGVCGPHGNYQGCGAVIYWLNKKPLNADGSSHRCGR